MYVDSRTEARQFSLCSSRTRKCATPHEKCFERLRHSQEGLLHTRTELADAYGEVEKLCAFISDVSSLKDKMIKPSEGYKHEERWKCGRIHLSTSGDWWYSRYGSCFPSSLKISPRVKNLFQHYSLLRFINFRWSGSQMANVISERRPFDEWKTFGFISGFPILIIGWSLSCGMATKKTRVVESSGQCTGESLDHQNHQRAASSGTA